MPDRFLVLHSHFPFSIALLCASASLRLKSYFAIQRARIIVRITKSTISDPIA